MKKIDLAFLLTAILMATPAAAEDKKKFQCWTDNKGQRMCGDRVPPEYAGQKREVIKDGRVVEIKKGAKTPEEIAAEERKVRETEEAKKREAYDRSLLESYRNAKDIEVMRDERLGMLDSRLKASEKSVAENEKTLVDLRARAAEAEKKAAATEAKDAKPMDPKLAKQIRQHEKALNDSQKSVERLTKEREQTQKKFELDMQRYNELRPPAPKPAAKPAA